VARLALATIALAATAATVAVDSAPVVAGAATPWPVGDECLPSLQQDLGGNVAVLDGLCLDGWAYVDSCVGCGGDTQAIAQYTSRWELAVLFPSPLCRADALATGMPPIVADRVNWPCDGGMPEPPPVADEFPLRVGSVGPRVATAQQQLAALGFDVGASGADGRFGPDTASAVIGWQQSVALPNTGELYEPSFVRLTGAPAPPPTAPPATTALPTTGVLLQTDAAGTIDPTTACTADQAAGVGIAETTVSSDWPDDQIVLKFAFARCSAGWAAVWFQGYAADDLKNGIIGDVSRLYLYDLTAGVLVATVDYPYFASRSISSCVSIAGDGQALLASLLYEDAPASPCDATLYQTMVTTKQVRVFDATGAALAPEAVIAAIPAAPASPWTFDGDWLSAVPQLGTEPVLGSGCGGNGEIGEVIPDGWWLVLVEWIDGVSMGLDLMCAYHGDAAIPFVEECAAQWPDEGCVWDTGFMPINNSDRIRPMPMSPGILREIEPNGYCRDAGIADYEARYLGDVMTWVRITGGQVDYVRYYCPFG